MRRIKISLFAGSVIVCAVTVVLLQAHLVMSSSDEHETNHETIVENHGHDGEESHADDADQDGDHEADHNAHEGHDEDGIQLHDEQLKEHGIEIATAGPGILHIDAEFPGEVVLNPESVCHVVPYMPGIVREVPKKLGDAVKAGEVIAILDSRELSELQSSYLVAKKRAELAETTFKREEALWKQRISSEKEYLEARQAFTEAEIEREAAEQKLQSLGFDTYYLEELIFHDERPLTYYEMVAPFDGMVIEKHITIGEAVSEETDAFVIADFSTVWVNLTIYQKELASLRVGQAVTIVGSEQNSSAGGEISYISPIIDRETRTVTARIELDNPDLAWRPGMFVTGEIAFDEVGVRVLIPRKAVFMMDDETIVFVPTPEGFVTQPLTLGKMNATHVEVLSGLTAGQQYVVEGGFELKADMVTAGLGSHAGHGH